jgi:hypothetical protein
VISGGISFAGAGTLRIFDSAMPSATLSGFTFGDAIDLASVVSSGGGTAFVSSSVASGNVLKVIEGGTTYQLQLDPTRNYTGVLVLLSQKVAADLI